MTYSLNQPQASTKAENKSFQSLSGADMPQKTAPRFFADHVQQRRFILRALVAVMVFVGGGFAIAAAGTINSLVRNAICGAYGFCCWTLVEYLYHRFVLHGITECIKKHAAITEEHLSLPGPGSRILIFTITIVAFWAAFYFHYLFWVPAGFAVGVGVGCYYRLLIDWPGFKSVAPALYRNRLYHTSGGIDKGFGWSTVAWDRYFDTYVPQGIVHSLQEGQ